MMVKIKVRTRMDVQKVIRAQKRGNLDSLGRASAYVRTVMKNTLGRRKKPRAPGQPATSRTGRARKSILFDVDKDRDSAIIGPSSRIMGASMAAHEFGGNYKGTDMPARPFAGPALEKSADKLAPFWRGSVKQ